MLVQMSVAGGQETTTIELGRMGNEAIENYNSYGSYRSLFSHLLHSGCYEDAVLEQCNGLCAPPDITYQSSVAFDNVLPTSRPHGLQMSGQHCMYEVQNPHSRDNRVSPCDLL